MFTIHLNSSSAATGTSSVYKTLNHTGDELVQKSDDEVMFIILLIIVFVLNGPPETLGKCILPLFIKIVLLFGEYNLRLFQDVAPGATKLSTFLFTNCAPTFLLTARRLGLFFPPGAQKQSNLR